MPPSPTAQLGSAVELNVRGATATTGPWVSFLPGFELAFALFPSDGVPADRVADDDDDVKSQAPVRVHVTSYAIKLVTVSHCRVAVVAP